ncbi:MAG: cytochrome c biogenesis protein ResB, partial [Flavobacteriaceae bacterium]|nr:cytochrome c biogenesis protein ResB [Flavobacteriaceae bacterium]
DEQGIVFKVSTDNTSKLVNVLGGQYISNPFETVEIDGLEVSLRYGTKEIELPFSIKLNDFIAERYPGTEDSYSSFESKITVLDPDGENFDYRIYMNNILDHEGYRFFQASFDPDEMGTRLSVNHDREGTFITYFGYFLLYFGLMAILFDKHTRFGDLKRRLKKVKGKKTEILATLVFLLCLSGFSQEEHTPDDGHLHGTPQKPTEQQIDSIIQANLAPEEHSEKFGKLVIQDYSGRMMPMNTFASEVLRKLSKQDRYKDFDANQVLLSMQESPLFWYNVPIIYLKPRKGDSIRTILNVPKDQKYLSLTNFLDENGNYLLSPYLEDAYRAQIPNGFQKEFKETDQRVRLLYNTLEGRFLKIFPLIDDENNTWISPVEYVEEYSSKVEDTLYGKFIKNSFTYYLSELYEAKQTGDFSTVDKLLASFKGNQEKHGSEVMLSDNKIETEILYNKYDIFKKLFSWYLYAGSLLFIILIVQIFKERNKLVDYSVTFLKLAIVLLFVLHTAGLAVRWYISGHAPWSDAYESMIYVAWATMFFGLAFGRKSDLTI